MSKKQIKKQKSKVNWDALPESGETLRDLLKLVDALCIMVEEYAEEYKFRLTPHYVFANWDQFCGTSKDYPSAVVFMKDGIHGISFPMSIQCRADLHNMKDRLDCIATQSEIMRAHKEHRTFIITQEPVPEMGTKEHREAMKKMMSDYDLMTMPTPFGYRWELVPETVEETNKKSASKPKAWGTNVPLRKK